MPFCPLDPGSGIDFFPDPGSQPHIFECLVTIIWVKTSIPVIQLELILLILEVLSRVADPDLDLDPHYFWKLYRVPH